jgi:hypothetical protein
LEAYPQIGSISSKINCIYHIPNKDITGHEGVCKKEVNFYLKKLANFKNLIKREAIGLLPLTMTPKACMAEQASSPTGS